MINNDPTFLVIDLFCGAGGTSTGFAQAMMEGRGLAKILACVNHDHTAIKSHWANYPEVKHFEEDIRTLNLTELIEIVRLARIKYPNAYVVLWASLECTNFSKAKGGQPRDADSRTLAEHLERYIEALNPDYVQIENVVEFMSWGPLDENGKPISKKKGTDWMRWRNEIKAMGYVDEWKELNSANYGAYTSRNRLFGVFAKPGLPITWPEPTHSKKPGDLKKWKPVKEVLDFTDEGESIFKRKKPLSDKTLERIYSGLLKYVAKGEDKFISKYYSGGKDFLAHYYGNGYCSSVDTPCPTLRTKDGATLIQPEFFIDKHYNSTQNQSINQPAGTIMPNDKHRLVEARHYLFNPSHGGHCTSTEKPCPVIVARQDKAPLYLVQAETGKIKIAVYDTDTPIAVAIKEFMAAHNIVDVKMRMLRVPELLRIQGFPSSYRLIGNQTQQKKFIGNSVVPGVVKAWVESMATNLYDHQKQAA